MPGIFGDHERRKQRGLRNGAILFLVASFLMVFACHFAAVEMAADPDHRDLKKGSPKLYCHTLHEVGLVFAQFGAVCFVVGSALYRPVFSEIAAAADEGRLSTWLAVSFSLWSPS